MHSSTNEELFDYLNEITTPSEDTKLNGYPLDQNDNLFICLDSLGRSQFLISVEESNSYPPPPNLSNLEVFYGQDCSIETDKGQISKKWIRVVCKSEEKEIVKVFLENLRPLLADLSLPVNPDRFSSVIEEMITLFKTLAAGGIRSERGLWGELFIIHQSSNKDLLVKTWHDENIDLYDFGMEGNRIEVKTSTPKERKHKISLNQAYPSEGLKVLLASVLLDKVQIGFSLRKLRDEILSALSSEELKLKLNKLIASSLGKDYAQSLDKAIFDYQIAKESLQFYDMNSIPRVADYRKIDRNITEVSFTSNLEGAKAIDKDDFAQKSDLFKFTLNS